MHVNNLLIVVNPINGFRGCAFHTIESEVPSMTSICPRAVQIKSSKEVYTNDRIAVHFWVKHCLQDEIGVNVVINAILG